MRIEILSIQSEPIHEIAFLNAKYGGGTVVERLPVLVAEVAGLPEPLAALVCTADLQGREDAPGAVAPRLLGEAVAEELATLAELGALPPIERTGVILAGDFYAAPAADLRGASGDVRAVWAAFAARFRWVAGVAGNHDQFGPDPGDQAAFMRQPRLHDLDDAILALDGLRCAGLGGVIGNPAKVLRRAADHYQRTLARLIDAQPDLVILHEGPAVVDRGYIGSPAIAATLASRPVPLVVSGHCRWPQPLARLANGTQLLNVDARVVVLRSARQARHVAPFPAPGAQMPHAGPAEPHAPQDRHAAQDSHEPQN